MPQSAPTSKVSSVEKTTGTVLSMRPSASCLSLTDSVPVPPLPARRRRRRSQSGSCTSRPAVSRRRRSCSTRGRASCSRRSACPSALRARRRTPARLLTPTSRGRRIPRGLGRSQKVASCVVGRAGLVAHVLTACVAQRLCLIARMQCLPSRWP